MIIIKIEGGLVRDVINYHDADDDPEVFVVHDYDIEGVDDGQLSEDDYGDHYVLGDPRDIGHKYL